MRTVTYKSLQDMVAGFLGWDPNNLSYDEQASINRAINRRAQFAWEAFYWPEWTVMEKRLFAPVWNNSFPYTPQSVRYYNGTRKYYSVLVANIATPPADATGKTDLANWADITSEPKAQNYSSTTNYVLGNRVYEPNADAVFQLYIANAINIFPVSGAGTGWEIVPTFERLIAYNQAGQTPLGDIKQLWEDNPRLNNRACAIDYKLEDGGVRALGTSPVVHVEFRLNVPSWTGAIWAAGNFNVGDQVYYSGDYYVCIAVATTQLPPDVTKWALIPMPYIISKYVAQGAYADVDGKAEGNIVAFGTENDEAFSIIQTEFDKIERQQQQTSQLNVVGMR